MNGFAEVRPRSTRKISGKGAEKNPESRSGAWALALVLAALYTVNYRDKLLLGLVAQPLAAQPRRVHPTLAAM